MKGFARTDRLLSLCGLNCGLCTMRLGDYCPGCGGGAGNQACAIARCSVGHGSVEYCWQCGEFPCAHYDGIDRFDSFITCKNRLRDLEKARVMGVEAYQAEQREKKEILRFLLKTCNDGRRKSFFALAVNLLELEVLRGIKARLAEKENVSIKESAADATALLHEAAARQGVSLKLRKKPGKNKT